MGQSRTTEGATQFEPPTTGGAIAIDQFVFVNRHGRTFVTPPPRSKCSVVASLVVRDGSATITDSQGDDLQVWRHMPKITWVEGVNPGATELASNLGMKSIAERTATNTSRWRLVNQRKDIIVVEIAQFEICRAVRNHFRGVIGIDL